MAGSSLTGPFFEVPLNGIDLACPPLTGGHTFPIRSMRCATIRAQGATAHRISPWIVILLRWARPVVMVQTAGGADKQIAGVRIRQELSDGLF